MKLQITIESENRQGAMDALWNVWEALRDNGQPIGGCCPSSMGDAYSYKVKATDFDFSQNRKGKPEQSV